MRRRFQRRFKGSKVPEKRNKLAQKTAKWERMTVNLDPSLIEEIKNAVVALSPLGLSIKGLVEDAVRVELRKLKKKHFDGENFPKRRVNPRRGRPLR